MARSGRVAGRVPEGGNTHSNTNDLGWGPDLEWNVWRRYPKRKTNRKYRRNMKVKQDINLLFQDEDKENNIRRVVNEKDFAKEFKIESKDKPLDQDRAD